MAGLACGLTVLLQGSVAWAGSAVTVPMAARDTAAAAKADAQAVLDRQQAEEYRQRAEKDARQAAEEAQQAGRQVESAQQALVEQETMAPMIQPVMSREIRCHRGMAGHIMSAGSMRDRNGSLWVNCFIPGPAVAAYPMERATRPTASWNIA